MIRFDTKKDMEHYDNLYHQIIEKDKQLDKYKNVINKIKEMFENNNLQEYYYGMSYEFEINDFKEDILKLLEEVE